MKRKRKERWDAFEVFLKKWIVFNKYMYATLPSALQAYEAAQAYDPILNITDITAWNS